MDDAPLEEHTFLTHSGDDEVTQIEIMMQVLNRLPNKVAKLRVLAYLTERTEGR